MAFESTVASLDNVQETQVAVSTTPQRVADLIAAANPAIVLPSQIREYSITNNDPTNVVYLLYGNSVSATKCHTQVAAANGKHQIAGNVGLLRRLWIVAAAGTPNVTVEVYS